MSDADLESALGSALGGVHVSGLHRLSGGASRETWAFDADGRPLILQRGRPAPERLGIAAQAALMRAAAAADVPVPAVVAEGADGDLGEEWSILERLDGETIAQKILRGPEFADARAHLVEQCAGALARIHDIPLEGLPVPEESDPVRRWRAILDGLGQPHPALELGLRWLERNKPAPAGRTLVHGDYRLGNFLVTKDGLRAVLDWELAHVGDPVEDLGWLCVKSWRFGEPSPVGGFAKYEELWAAYERATGRHIDPDGARWWEVFGNVRWGVICIIQATTHLSGAERSVELATIGRRVCEVEWDVLELVS